MGALFFTVACPYCGERMKFETAQFPPLTTKFYVCPSCNEVSDVIFGLKGIIVQKMSFTERCKRLFANATAAAFRQVYGNRR